MTNAKLKSHRDYESKVFNREVDNAMLSSLQSISHPRIQDNRIVEKCQHHSDYCAAILKERDKLWAQGGGHFMGMVWRNKPDERGIVLTTLDNLGTLNAVLAIRAGVEVSAAIALAYDDLIFSTKLDCPDGGDDRALTASLCGTLSLVNAGEMFKFALFAEPSARTYQPRFQSDELILAHQTVDGLCWARDFVAETFIHQLWDHSVNESVQLSVN